MNGWDHLEAESEETLGEQELLVVPVLTHVK
jgi:hypothetical protein